ncbi:MAG: 2-amino-4-hydroxy-6-hydroxymethyldihydropteridine diphosphokinase [Porticoccaceae bacterium]|nr:MAG: 2-amino-4-hydroxy-6-hydroxymethyldihydropteridine diphosphokinase [Porticoccaceae bacterium]
MARVWTSIGSNIDRERNVRACLDALADQFGPLVVSSLYETAAVGFTGDDFYNLVAGFDTELPVGEVAARLRAIEAACGRRRDGPRFGPRTLDVDLLTYDALVGEVDGVRLPRPEILTDAFVLGPLAEVAGEEEHPVAHRRYADLWRELAPHAPPLRRIPFCWRGRALPLRASA